MIIRVLLLTFVVALAAAACSAPEVNQEPVVAPVEETPKIVTNDPFEARLAKFDGAYRDLVCKANRDYDPMSSIGMLKEPYAELTRLVAEESKSIEVYEQILQAHGYANAGEFFADRERIDNAKRGWFGELTGELFDIMEDCGKK